MSSNLSSLYLRPEDDGLLMRQSQFYAIYKLNALRTYLWIVNRAMHTKWPNRIYIDLQAGPGKNQIRNHGIALGSPLIAVTAPYPTRHLLLNELSQPLHAALQTRLTAAPGDLNIQLRSSDANVVVDEFVNMVREFRSSALCVAFLDPEGAELHWSTVRKLAELPRMDLIINVPTGGIRRMLGDIQRTQAALDR
jgi:three-Cys-motif partner protein